MKLQLTELRAKNYRNFQDIAIKFGDRTFLVGSNASGKSNLLDILRFLKDLVDVGGGLQYAIQKREGFSSIRSLSARKKPSVVIEVDLKDSQNGDLWSYSLEFNDISKGSKNIVQTSLYPTIIREVVTRNNSPLITRPTSSDTKDLIRLTQTYLEQVNMNQKFREIATFFSSIDYLHIVPQLIREPERSIGYIHDPYGGDFLDQIFNENNLTRNKKLQLITKTLKSAIPQLSDLKIERDKKGTSHLKAKYDNWRPRGAWQNERQLSDGTLRLIGLLWAILEGSGPLLLEEPELSLHPAIVTHIPGIITQIQHYNERQIIMSTHSPDILRDEGIGLDEVFMLIPSSEGTEVIPVSSLSDAKILLESGLDLADLVSASTRPKNIINVSFFGDT